MQGRPRPSADERDGKITDFIASNEPNPSVRTRIFSWRVKPTLIARMSIRLSEDEAWAELDRAHTGIFTTLTRDVWPISMPMWFAAVDRRIYLRPPSKSKK